MKKCCGEAEKCCGDVLCRSVGKESCWEVFVCGEVLQRFSEGVF